MRLLGRGLGFCFRRSPNVIAATATTAITYNTLIGNGVDTNGFTDLPLRPTLAVRYFVGSGGSDANTGLSHAQRLASVNAAWQKVVSGQGDQILVAEGTTLAECLPIGGDTGGFLGNKTGFSALYPLVFSTYDPADPTNTAKYGMGHQRSARPIFTRAAGAIGGPAYVAVKGWNFQPGNIPDNVFSGVGSTLNTVLFENCIFAYTGLSLTDGGDGVATAVGQNVIVRNCASYSVYSASTAFVQNFYCDGVNGVTYEDNVNYHSGWRDFSGITRDTAAGSGGPSVFRHPIYIQANCNNITVRRNLIMDGAADGGIARGDNINWSENVTIRCPAGTGLGPGNATEFGAFTSGVLVEARQNLSLAAIDLNSTSPSGYGYTLGNFRPGSRIHHNLLMRSTATSATNDVAYATTGGSAYSLPTRNNTCYLDNNISYLWSGGATLVETGTPISNTYANNIWDSAASGSNITRTSGTYSNAYTEAALYTAAGVTDYPTLVSLAIANPEQHYQRNLRTLAFAGYNVPAIVADTTAPTLSLPTATSPATSASVGATTNEANGYLFCVITVGSTPPTAAQIRVGKDSTGAAGAGSSATLVTATGAVASTITGLAGTTAYYAHFVHIDLAGNASNVVSSAQFTTGAAVSYATLSTTDLSNITLSNGNLTAVPTSNNATIGGVRASRGASSGKVYWEYTNVVNANDPGPGVADATAALVASLWGQTANADAAGTFGTTLRYNATTKALGADITANNPIGFALDVTNKLLYVRNSTGWLFGCDPVAGTGGLSLGTMTTPMYPAWQGTFNDKGTFNFGATAYSYTPPTGYGNL